MGNFFRRAAGAALAPFTGGYSLAATEMPHRGNPFNPGPTGNSGYGNDQMNSAIQHSEQVPLDQVQFNSAGFPVGQYGPPSARVAPAYQYLAEQNAVQRQNNYFNSALGNLGAAQRTLESYRPGGAAALQSGIYQQQAQLNYQIGTQQRAPDLLFDYRRDAGAQAQHAAAMASQNQLIAGALGGLSSLAGAAIGAGARPATLNPAQPPMPGAVPGAAGGQPAIPGAGGYGAFPNLGGGGGQQYVSPTLAATGGAGGAAGQTLLSARLGGGGGGGGGGGPQPASGGAPSGGPAHGAGGSPGGSPGGAPPFPGGGGYGADGNFSQTALAAHAAQQNPMLGNVMTMVQAQTMDDSFYAAASTAVDRLLGQSMWALEAA